MLDEFRGLDEFTVMYQPWSTNVSVIILPIAIFTEGAINCITL